MFKKLFPTTLLLSLLLVVPVSAKKVKKKASIALEHISTFEPEENPFDESVAEINAYDSKRERLYVTNANATRLDVWDLGDLTDPVQLKSLELSTFGGGVNSVAVHKNWLAIAVQNDIKTDLGSIVIYNLKKQDPLDYSAHPAAVVTVGALPDMVTFTPNGKYVLCANEGEPNDDYTVDPEGSISIIPLLGPDKFHAVTAGFESFNSKKDHLIACGVRIFGPGASVAEDLEPEYITVSKDSKTAYVSLQENNAIAIVDIKAAEVVEIKPLGFKDHHDSLNALDASNRDSGINISAWPVLGMYQPDALASYSYMGKTFIVTANEGDSRDYDGFSEETRVEDEDLDPNVFPDAASLRMEENLGRLKITNTLGNTTNGFEKLYSYGGRSFSILDEDANIVWDSESEFEDITAKLIPHIFNTDNDEEIPEDGFDSRSDDKGPEPEAVAVGKIRHSTYAFIGLERVGGIMVYDVTIPTAPVFVEYVRTEGDLGPEGITFVEKSKNGGGPLLIVSNEVSGTTTVYRINVG